MATTTDPPDGPARAGDATVIDQPAHPSGGREDRPPPGQAPWYRRGWAIGIIALLVGAGVGVAVGLTTKSTPKAKTVTAPAQTIVHTVAGPTKTIAQVRTVVGPTRTVTATATVTRTVQASAPVPSAQPSGPTGGGGSGNTFNGNGSQNLGTITVPSDSTLYWQCGGCSSMDISSQTNSDGNSISISSTATSGQSPVSAGAYDNVQVSADGAFTIAIK